MSTILSCNPKEGVSLTPTEIVERCITQGRPLRVSRRPHVFMNVFELEELGYLKREDGRNNTEVLRWNDQFPVMMSWEGSSKNCYYEPGAVVHIISKERNDG